MNKLFSTLFSSLRAKFTALWTKLRLWLTPTFWRTKGFTLLRQWFAKLFDVRPRNRKDYYPVFRWLVSKRLAFAAVVVLGVVCVWYISATLPAGLFGGSGTGLRTYKYSAIPLKFHSGSVRILAGDGHLAYVGQVEGAQCAGEGTLYDSQGNKVYEGDFAESMYNGTGTLYYPDGAVRYQGEFSDNLFQGTGSYYRPSGTLEYTGGYDTGRRSGQGTLYNAAATPVFTGAFLMDQIVYSQLLDKDTSAVAQMYTGRTGVWTAETEYAVSMDEIGAVYGVDSGENSLEGGWTVNSVYVLSDSFPVEGERLTTVNQLTAHFGQPDFLGSSSVTLPEAVAVNLLAQEDDSQLGTVDMDAQADFDDTYTVTDYDRDYQIYLSRYQADGLPYTFYSPAAGAENFVMYAIETA